MPDSLRVPLARPRPDAAAFIRALDGEVKPQRPPLIEYVVDNVIIRPVVVDMLGRRWVDPVPGDRASLAAYLDNYVAFWQHLGYDTLHYFIGLPFAHRTVAAPDTASAGRGMRHWSEQHTPFIASWDDFERYPWPCVGQVDFFPIEYLSSHLPEGMGLTAEHNSHSAELLSDAFTYEGLCLALHDQPDLVQAVAERIGALVLGFYEQLADFDSVVAFFAGDDMGFRSGTLISPEDLRRYVVPWHAANARVAHAHRKRYYLHSCGNLEAIVADLVETVRIDGKHSFEDAIIPVEDFHRRYGGRISSLGGVDVDVLARGGEEDVRRRTHQVIDACTPLGRVAVGSGNSIPSYVPLANYLAMVAEALR